MVRRWNLCARRFCERPGNINSQSLRTASWPDHLHLLVDGVSDGSDLRAFIKAAKQYSGYHFKQLHHAKLWQRYGYEHALRDDFERATTLRYILDNPVCAGLVKEPADYAFLGSDCYSVSELVQQAAPRG